jgi:hypothetical protein
MYNISLYALFIKYAINDQQNPCFHSEHVEQSNCLPMPSSFSVLSNGYTGPKIINRQQKGWQPHKKRMVSYGYGSIPINTIFRGMNIHLPAILMFTRGTRF